MAENEQKYTHPDLRKEIKEEIRELLDHEKRHKNRKTLVESLNRKV